MEFSLVSGQDINFGEGQAAKLGTIARSAFATVVNIGGGGGGATNNGSNFGEGYNAQLENSIVQNSGNKRQRLSQQINGKLNIWLYVDVALPTGVLRVEANDTEESVLTRLEGVCGGIDKFTADVEMEVGKGSDAMKIEVKGQKMKHYTLRPIKASGFDFPVTFNEALATKWRGRGSSFSARLSINLKLCDDSVNLLHYDNLWDPLSVNKKMIMDTVTMDAVLIAENGAEVKCHRVFLGAHSPVFRAMFESTMREGVTNTVELREMTEAAIRALLAYVYCWDITECSKCCSITLELLVAADKYGIENLQRSVRELILAKRNDWFTVSVALQMLQFAKNKCEGEDPLEYKMIERKAAAVLKSKSASELDECPEYVELFKDPKIGKDLCSYFITSN